jgi:hypothetical protein
MVKCDICKKPLLPNQQLVPWFVQDANHNVVDRSSVHLKCLVKGK